MPDEKNDDAKKASEGFNLLLSNQYLAGKMSVVNTLMANSHAMENPTQMTLLISQISQSTHKAKLEVEKKLKKLDEYSGGKDGKANK